MAKAKQAPVVEEVEGGAIEVNSNVRFLGYDEETPEEERILEEGAIYPVAELPGEEDGEATGYILRAPNPDFNPKKKASEANPEFVEVEVFEEEIELVADEDESAEEEEGELTLEEVEGMDKTELLALAKDEGITLTAAQKKTADSIRAVIVEALSLGEEEQEEEQEEAPEEKAPAKPAKGKAATKPAAKAAAKEEAAPAKGKGKAAAKEAAPAKGKAAAKSAAKPAPKVAVEEDELPDLEGEDESVLALIEENRDDLIALAQNIESEVSASEYRLGGVLYHIKKEKAYLSVEGGEQYDEKGGFQKFLIDFFNIGYRKAQYLIEIYISFTQAGIEDAAEVVARLGWTKAQKIAAPMLQEGADIEELVQLAETNPVVDLSEILKEQFEVGGSKTPGEKKSRTTLKFRYTEEEANIVEDILNVAGEKLGTSGEQALFQILSEWAVTNNVETAQTAKAASKPAAKTATKPAAKAASKPAAKARAKA